MSSGNAVSNPGSGYIRCLKCLRIFLCDSCVSWFMNLWGLIMRIAIGQLWQETNTLNPLPTTRADFEAFGIYDGAELLERFADTNELGGFIQSLRAWPEHAGDRRSDAARRLAERAGRRTRRSTGLMDGMLDALAAGRHGRCGAAGAARVDGRGLRAGCRRASAAARPGSWSGRRCRSWRRSICTPISRGDGRAGRRAGAVSHGSAHRRAWTRASAEPRCCGASCSTARGR